MFDAEIPIRMSAAMREIQRFVSHGYVFYTTGVMSASVAANVVLKLHNRFEFGMTAGQRDAARRRGQCSFRLVIFPLPKQTDLAFWVLRSDGDHPYLASETWLDARVTPIRWPYWYELRQMPVPAALRAQYKRSDGRIAIRPVTWTWRIQRDEMERIRWNIRRWVEQRDERLSQLVFALSRAPGFRAVRDDVYQLHTYIRSQCAKQKAPEPELRRMPWISARRIATVPLSALLRRVQRGATTWFPDKVSNQKKSDTAITQSQTEISDVAEENPKTGETQIDPDVAG